MSDGDFVDRFDKRVTSMWIIIALGFTKAIEQVVEIASRAIDVTAFGADITLLAMYLALMTAGTTILIAMKTIE